MRKTRSFIPEFIKKIYLLFSLNDKIWDTYYDHIAIILALHTQHRTILSNFFKKQFFFLIPTLHYTPNIKLLQWNPSGILLPWSHTTWFCPLILHPFPRRAITHHRTKTILTMQKSANSTTIMHQPNHEGA